MNTAAKLVVSALAIALGVATQIGAQSPEAFDAASIKVSTAGGGAYPGLLPGGKRFTATNLPLTALIMLAYDATPGQISGVPGPLDREGYDVEATTEHTITKEQASRMLQTLLADRFKLTVHRETRDQPVYALILAKGGPKLQETPAEETGLPDTHRSGSGFVFRRTPMATLTLVLSQLTGRTVVDKTGLAGRYDFSLGFAVERPGRGGPDGNEAAPSPEGLPTIFTALQEQIGLRLESQKGQVEFFVVDHAEKPSAN